MILIWGFKVRFKTLLEGVFFCPTCGGDRGFARKQGRRWFTFFFVPVIPLGNVGDEFVECTTCQSAYRPTVLDLPTSAAMADTLVTATREAMVWMLRVGRPTAPTVAAAIQVLSRTANRPWSEHELQADVANLDVNGLLGRLTMMAGVLNEHGKESFLAACARVASADGAISPEEQQLLDHVAGSLSMSPAHARGVIAQATESRL